MNSPWHTHHRSRTMRDLDMGTRVLGVLYVWFLCCTCCCHARTMPGVLQMRQQQQQQQFVVLRMLQQYNSPDACPPAVKQFCLTAAGDEATVQRVDSQCSE